MNPLRLVLRGLAFHARSHLGVVAGSAVATAVLVGAMVVGDSLKAELRRRALLRLGPFVAAHDGRDRYLATSGTNVGASRPGWAAVVRLPGMVARQDGSARANRVHVLGIDDAFLALGSPSRPGLPTDDGVWLNAALAARLGAKEGDALVVRLHKPGALSMDAIVSPRDDASVALRARVERILPDADGGAFDLSVGHGETLNAFVRRDLLQRVSGLGDRANVLLHAAASSAGGTVTDDAQAAAEAAARRVQSEATLDDMELTVRVVRPPVNQTGGEPAPVAVELATRRIFLEEPVARAALATRPAGIEPQPVATYLVNTLRSGDRMTPYSMVAATRAPEAPADLREDEVVVNDWLANDLGVAPGAALSMTYYEADSAARLVERTNEFRVRSVVPMRGAWADRTRMPEFPGLSKAESTHDWDAGFDLVHKIRDQDEAYWKQWRGTPKAWIHPATGSRMWSNRFGSWTAVRWRVPEGQDADALAATVTRSLREGIQPAQVGLAMRPVRSEALNGAATGTAQMFVGLFVGFSLFLIVSALLLTSLLFRFGIEQRAGEVGILLALGWKPGKVRRLFLGEGMLLAWLAMVPGVALGLGYARGILWGLNHAWSDAIAGLGVRFEPGVGAVAGGAGAGAMVGLMALAWTLRGLARRPARELLNEGAGGASPQPMPGSTRALRVPWTSLLFASGVALIAWGFKADEAARPGLFFGAGALVMAASLAALRDAWGKPRRRVEGLSLGGLAWRSPGRRPGRSLATVTLLASATFLIVALAAFRLEARREAGRRSGGTGGFTHWVETALPVAQDVRTEKGRDAVGLAAVDVEGVEIVPVRVRDGDDASCLNLSKAARPRLLGVDPAVLAARGSFTFAAFAKGVDPKAGWRCLESTDADDAIPVVGDMASIQYALQRRVGDMLELEDGQGKPMRVRLVGAVRNSTLQGSLVMSEDAFRRRFPGESGWRMFWMEAPAARHDAVGKAWSQSLRDQGGEVTGTEARLDRFNAVQNTYLGTFQVLGGLGLLLGSAGLGIVVLRNVHERRGELAILRAMGFATRRVRLLVLWEHVALVLNGLGLGMASAWIAVAPVTLGPGGSGLPWATLGPVLGLVLINGLAWTWLATRWSCRGGLLQALRGE
ncbi:MAG: FtsX-like permease family protein [Verrucomicrobiota bacterium]